MIEMAKRRVANFPKQRSYRHCAMVIRGGCILSVGVNAKEMHAEVVALTQLSWGQRAGTMVLSLRIRKDGSLAMARPCPSCMQYMKHFGVKKVLYSNSNGVMIKERI
jgi:pyrimidine deaminase RibD-like protein